MFLAVSNCHIIAPDSESALASIVSDSDIRVYALPVIQLSLLHCFFLISWTQRLIPLSFSKNFILVLLIQMSIPLPAPQRLILIPYPQFLISLSLSQDLILLLFSTSGFVVLISIQFCYC